MKKCGIYRVISPNNKIYIGQSININKRFKDYEKLKSDNQLLLHRSFLKYGVINHIFEIIEECSRESLNERERYWQEYYDVLNHKKGLNLKYTQTNEKYQVLADSARKKISVTHKGKVRTETNKQKISAGLSKYYLKNPGVSKGRKLKTINNKLTSNEVLQIRAMLIEGKTASEIASIYSISTSTILQIKQGRTWQSLGEFKLKGKASRLKKNDLDVLFKMFDEKAPVKEIQKVLPYCITTIAKQRKIWKQLKN